MIDRKISYHTVWSDFRVLVLQASWVDVPKSSIPIGYYGFVKANQFFFLIYSLDRKRLTRKHLVFKVEFSLIENC